MYRFQVGVVRLDLTSRSLGRLLNFSRLSSFMRFIDMDGMLWMGLLLLLWLLRLMVLLDLGMRLLLLLLLMLMMMLMLHMFCFYGRINFLLRWVWLSRLNMRMMSMV